MQFHLGLGAHSDPDALACWIVISGEALREAKVRARIDLALGALHRRISDIVREGVTTRAFSCRSANAAATALLATIQGYFVIAATARDLVPRGTACTSTLHMAEGLLAPTRPLVARRGAR